ncbi:MAG: J domain-containing protein [Proteobacteria bacterium]|nr:J domain-containing protein [Pseudomonadota bacterium]
MKRETCVDDLIHNCYQILKLPPGASAGEVKEAYRRLKQESSADEEEWERLKEVNWAYENLVKYLSQHEKIMPQAEEAILRKKDAAPYESDEFSLKGLLFSVDEKVNPFYFGGRVFVFLIFFIWGVKFIFHSVESNYAGESFMHGVTLAFHEAGHLIFGILGDFMGVLGGTLLQIIIPLVCLGAFLKRADTFSASIALWWVGQNFMDAAPYINDARKQELMLLGGVTGQDVPGFHDWNNILGRLGLLKLDHFLANTSHYFGVLLMLASFAWGGYILYRQYKNLDK